MIIIHYHRHHIRVSKETTIYWFTWRYQQLMQPQNTQLPKKKVIFKFPFLHSRFISVFNSVTSKNPKLEWDTDWCEQALHVITLSCGALQSSHRELSEPHGWPGTLNWDPSHPPACTVKNLPQEALQAGQMESASSSHKPKLDVSDPHYIFPLQCSAWGPAAFLPSKNPCSCQGHPAHWRPWAVALRHTFGWRWSWPTEQPV